MATQVGRENSNEYYELLQIGALAVWLVKVHSVIGSVFVGGHIWVIMI